MQISRMFLLISFTISLKKLSARIQKRVVGGQNIDIEDAPYMLSLMLHSKHICGAAVINEKWGITAAHCASASENPLKELKIRSGTSKREKGGVVHNIIKIVTHEKYSAENDNYDIAVLQVQPTFANENITRAVKLPVGKIYSKYGKATGWGCFSPECSNLSEMLESAVIPKVPRVLCQVDYLGRYLIKENYVCYGFREGTSDTCKGDSGGPLVNKDGILLGITAWGGSCATPKTPGVYIDVVPFIDWINDKINV